MPDNLDLNGGGPGFLTGLLSLGDEMGGGKYPIAPSAALFSSSSEGDRPWFGGVRLMDIRADPTVAAPWSAVSIGNPAAGQPYWGEIVNSGYSPSGIDNGILAKSTVGFGQGMRLGSPRAVLVQTSVDNAQNMTAQAMADIQRANIWGGPTDAYAKAMGKYDQRLGQIIENNLGAINQGLREPLTFRNTIPSDPKYNRNEYAFVNPSVPGVINLQPLYWTAPPVGDNSQAGIVVHEVSHLRAGTDKDETRYGKEVYGKKALDRAKTDPEWAVQNADNYEYYVEHFKPTR
ncbi:MAG TPA: M35 family metallo-endopeptidase [Burkholderiales bacterium]|nr:M35 family metallo-endopeptidase [Burkholderiales bacterium]